jgi:uncharacterized membrane protein YgcG
MEPFMKTITRRFAFALCAALSLAIAACAQNPAAYDSGESYETPAAQAAPLPSLELEQLVAPIALYPDALVAQVLAAATYPDEIADAASWMQQNPGLKGQQLADAVNIQSWDPSVKALAQFPSVLTNMNQNLSWTSALGEAYMNQPGQVMDTVQVLRRRAQAAGHLGSSSQQTVTTQGQTIVIQPANPAVVYVPAYDPWLVYGIPVSAYPGWVDLPGLYYAGPGIYWGLGFDVGLFAGFGWGWHHWGFDWRHRALIHDHAPWHSQGRAFGHFGGHGPPFEHGGEHFAHAAPMSHGPGPGSHPGAFSGFNHGGMAHGFSGRGHASLGGFHGGGFHAGGGGFHGGSGGHGGGGHR